MANKVSKFQVVLQDGTVATRNSRTMLYTHAVLATASAGTVPGVYQWSQSLVNAQKAAKKVAGWGWFHVQVVEVELLERGTWQVPCNVCRAVTLVVDAGIHEATCEACSPEAPALVLPQVQEEVQQAQQEAPQGSSVDQDLAPDTVMTPDELDAWMDQQTQAEDPRFPIQAQSCTLPLQVGMLVQVDESRGLGSAHWVGSITHVERLSPYVSVMGMQVRKYEVTPLLHGPDQDLGTLLLDLAVAVFGDQPQAQVEVQQQQAEGLEPDQDPFYMPLTRTSCRVCSTPMDVPTQDLDPQGELCRACFPQHASHPFRPGFLLNGQPAPVQVQVQVQQQQQDPMEAFPQWLGDMMDQAGVPQDRAEPEPQLVQPEVIQGTIGGRAVTLTILPHSFRLEGPGALGGKWLEASLEQQGALWSCWFSSPGGSVQYDGSLKYQKALAIHQKQLATWKGLVVPARAVPTWAQVQGFRCQGHHPSDICECRVSWACPGCGATLTTVGEDLGMDGQDGRCGDCHLAAALVDLDPVDQVKAATLEGLEQAECQCGDFFIRPQGSKQALCSPCQEAWAHLDRNPPQLPCGGCGKCPDCRQGGLED